MGTSLESYSGGVTDVSSGVAAEASALFRTKRVAEIKQIEARVRADAEERSLQLRTMLGTRYVARGETRRRKRTKGGWMRWRVLTDKNIKGREVR